MATRLCTWTKYIGIKLQQQTLSESLDRLCWGVRKVNEQRGYYAMHWYLDGRHWPSAPLDSFAHGVAAFFLMAGRSKITMRSSLWQGEGRGVYKVPNKLKEVLDYVVQLISTLLGQAEVHSDNDCIDQKRLSLSPLILSITVIIAQWWQPDHWNDFGLLHWAIKKFLGYAMASPQLVIPSDHRISTNHTRFDQ